MKKYLGLFAITLSLLAACNKPEELPIKPEISFENATYKEVENGTDSLILTINFQDGDGDLGLESDEVEPPFHSIEYVKNSNGNYIEFGDSPDLPPFNVCDYNLESDGAGGEDTLLVEINPRHYNIFIDFYVDRDGDGELEVYDFRRENGIYSCETYDGRFFPLKEGNKARPLVGELTYNIVAPFDLIFRTNLMRIEVSIMDRAGHLSNTASTPEFTLEEISAD